MKIEKLCELSVKSLTELINATISIKIHTVECLKNTQSILGITEIHELAHMHQLCHGITVKSGVTCYAIKCVAGTQESQLIKQLINYYELCVISYEKDSFNEYFYLL